MIKTIHRFLSLRSEIGMFICEYVKWKASKISKIAAETDHKILTDFAAFSGKKSIEGIEYSDMEAYRLHLALKTGSKYRVLQAMKSINCLLRFAQARGYLCIDAVTFSEDEVLSNSLMKEEYMSQKKTTQKRRVGRPSIDPQVIRKIQFLKDNQECPLSYNEIARVVQKDKAQVIRLYNRAEEMRTA